MVIDVSYTAVNLETFDVDKLNTEGDKPVFL